MSRPERVSLVESVSLELDARTTMNVIDTVINELYLPFRGAEGYDTERAVLVAEPHIAHRENDAEHSWGLAFTARILWDNREPLGISFEDGFDVDKAVQMAIDHDVIEIWTGDVNALTKDINLIELKAEREHNAQKLIRNRYPFLTGLVERVEEYEPKDTPEARYISDLDKIIATRIIFLDGGKKWHDWEGQATSQQHMLHVIRGKLLTDLGHQLFDVQEQDIDLNPYVFPFIDDRTDVDVQLRIFN